MHWLSCLTPFMGAHTGFGTLDRTSSWTTVLVVRSTRTVCSSFSSSSPFSINCHNILMMFPAAACVHTHQRTVYSTNTVAFVQVDVCERVWPQKPPHVTWVSEWQRDTAEWSWVLWFRSPWGTAGPPQNCSPSELIHTNNNITTESVMSSCARSSCDSPARTSVCLAAMVLIFTMPDSAA